MSFLRLIYYSAMVGGWAAFVGWFLGEAALMWRAAAPADWKMVVTVALCGALIGGGLNFLAGLATGQLVQALPRLAVGLGLGFVSGIIGSLLGNLFFKINTKVLGSLVGPSNPIPGFLGLMVGWTIMGLCIGVVEGIYDLNWRKIRNGMVGGAVGGFLGGMLFGPFTWILGSPMSSRAVALVILGMCIGLSIGLAQVILREAWITVEDGFRPGRQLMLGQRETFLGTSEKANLIFIAFGARGVEPLHVCIERLPDGTYAVRDNGSRSGTLVNEQPLQGAAPLRNGDVIQFGVNKVRFNERYRPAGVRTAPVPAMPLEWQPPSEAPVPVASAIRAALAPPQAMPQATPSQAVRPAAPAMAAPNAAPAPIPAKPPPPRAPVAPTATPVPAPAPRAQPSANECPICGTPAASAAGKRRCENCGAMF